MTLKTLFKTFSGGNTETVQRLQKRVAASKAELGEAQAAYRVAALEDSRRGGSSLPVKKAGAAVANARECLERAEAALAEAVERKAGLERAQRRGRPWATCKVASNETPPETRRGGYPVRQTTCPSC